MITCAVCGFSAEAFPDCGLENCMKPCCPACNTCQNIDTIEKSLAVPAVVENRKRRRAEYEEFRGLTP